MDMETKEIDTQPRQIPFMTDENRTASDMLLVIAHNISAALVNLTNITDEIAKLAKQEAEARITTAFSVTFKAPAKTEWAKEEKTTRTEPSPAVDKTQPAGNPPETEQK